MLVYIVEDVFRNLLLLFKVFISGADEIGSGVAPQICTVSSKGLKAVEGKQEGGCVQTETETPFGSTLLLPHTKATWIVWSDVTVLKYIT